jgi:hypothetical protein
MQKLKVIACSTFIYAGEIVLILLLLSGVNNFFPRDVRPFIPDSSDYLMIAILYGIRLIFLTVAVVLLIREIRLTRKDWANPKDFWFVRKTEDSAKDKLSTGV